MGVLNLAQGGCGVGEFLRISKVLGLPFTFGAHTLQGMCPETITYSEDEKVLCVSS